MFSSATDGQRPNNKQFSSCSLDRIRPVLETKSDCFESECCFLSGIQAYFTILQYMYMYMQYKWWSEVEMVVNL